MDEKTTLRDELAMAALTGFLAADPERATAYRPQFWAKKAYEWADVMLAARALAGGEE